MEARQSESQRTAEEVRSYDRQVWDMVQHLVHPVALYVLLQVVISSRYADHPGLDGLGVAVFAAQFLGAWAVFLGTLLRDMEFPSYVPLVLVLLALAGCAAMFVLPHPANSSAPAVRVFMACQLVPAVVAWTVTWTRWRRLKARHAPGDGA